MSRFCKHPQNACALSWNTPAQSQSTGVAKVTLTEPSPEMITVTSSPAAGHCVWTRLPVRTIWPACSASPRSARLLASHASAFWGVSHHIGPDPAGHLHTIDQGLPCQARQVRRNVPRHRLTQHTSGREEVIGNQGSGFRVRPVGVALIHDLDGRHVGLNRLTNVLCRERCIRHRYVPP
jgi:hypothetical protein